MLAGRFGASRRTTRIPRISFPGLAPPMSLKKRKATPTHIIGELSFPAPTAEVKAQAIRMSMTYAMNRRSADADIRPEELTAEVSIGCNVLSTIL
jgi:hypothetical protein